MNPLRDRDTYYLSVDVEATGPIPGPNSMIALGIVLLTEDGREVDSFSANLTELDGSTRDPNTMRWWTNFPHAWKLSTTDPKSPEKVMRDLERFLHPYSGDDCSLTLVGYPVTFDFMWVYWYWWYFNRTMPPWSFSGLDIKTYASALLRTNYRNATKKNWKKRWKKKSNPSPHVAVEDAREQGLQFIELIKHQTQRHLVEFIKPLSILNRPDRILIDDKLVVSTWDGSISIEDLAHILVHTGDLTEPVDGRIPLSTVSRLLQELGCQVTTKVDTNGYLSESSPGNKREVE